MTAHLIGDICAMAPVIPVVVIDDATAAPPLARALVAGGLPVIEVTLRTPAAAAAIAAIAREVPDAIVGAGTVLGSGDLAIAYRAGARFGVSPGATPALLDAVAQSRMPFLPGAATASEAMELLERGYTLQKFFPAESSGGVAALKALAGPLPQVRFCPTGGVGEANAARYLALANVVCVGGSWVAPPDAIRAGDYARIERLAKAAAGLVRR